MSNLYPFLERPDIETIDIGGPGDDAARGEEPRVGHDRHRAPTSTARCSTSCARTTAPSATRPARAFALEAFARTAAYDAAIVQWLAGATSCCRSTSSSRSSAPTRRCATARTRTSRPRAYRRRGTTSWWDGVDAARRARALVPQLLRHRRGVAARARSRRRPACAIIKHANPCGVAVDDELADGVPTRARVRRAFGVRRHRRAEPADRRRDRRAHGRRSAGRRRHRAGLRRRSDRGAAAASARTRGILEAARARPRRARLPPDLRRLPRADAAPLRVEPQRLARRHQGRADDRAVARPRARVAHLRAREVERDRARQGRPGGRHRRRPAEPRRVGRDRGEEGRGPGPRRRVRERRLLSVRRRRRGGRRGRRRRGHPTGRRDARRSR